MAVSSNNNNQANNNNNNDNTFGLQQTSSSVSAMNIMDLLDYFLISVFAPRTKQFHFPLLV